MKKEWNAYKAYVYDLDDTLYRETDYLFAAYARIAEACTTDPKKRAEYTDYLCRSFAVEGRQGLFQRFQAQYGVTLPIETMLSLLRTTECALELFPERKEEIEELLKQGKKIAVITNGNVLQQRQKVHNLRLQEIFPQIDIFYAAETESKPSPTMLITWMNKQGLAASEVLVIGDGETDCEMAMRAQTGWMQVKN